MISLLGALIGGLLAIVGGLIGAIYAARTVRKTRMEELIAERKITANAEAYSALKEIQGLFIQAAPEVTNQALQAREGWFFSNRLFFPGNFPALWLSIRNDIQDYHFGLFSRTKDEKELAALSERIRSNLTAAIMEVYADMGLRPIELGGKTDLAA
jgi:hypothetical protein